VRFLHTADWQIGMPAAQFGNDAEGVREARFTSVERLVSLAQAENADFIVVAGDVFDDINVHDRLVQRIARIVGSFEKPVFLLPGNHDPGDSVSLWHRKHLWSDAPNVVLCTERKPIVVTKEVTIFPCPLMEKRSGHDPTAWISDHLDIVGFRIGLAHGGLCDAGVPNNELNFPIPRHAAEALRLDYLALGDWHGYLEFPDAAGVIRTVYSGTHERTAFDDKNPGNVAIVEIEYPGAAPRVQRRAVGNLTWIERRPADLSSEALGLFIGELQDLQPRERHIVRVVIDGTVRADAMLELTALRALKNAGFLWFDINDADLRSAPSDDRWIDVLPIGSLRDAASALAADATSDPAAMDALELLYDIASRHDIKGEK
jgi:DNA repair exonuclease SbcCD nuclease subunit